MKLVYLVSLFFARIAEAWEDGQRAPWDASRIEKWGRR